MLKTTFNSLQQQREKNVFQLHKKLRFILILHLLWNLKKIFSFKTKHNVTSFLHGSFCSVQFSCSVVFDSLQSHGLQHPRLPCPSPAPGACSNSCPLSRWCHPTITSSVVPFSSRLQSFPATGSFQMSQFFASGGQSIGASASASVLPVNIQGWFPLRMIGLISMLSKEFSRVFSNTTVQKH